MRLNHFIECRKSAVEAWQHASRRARCQQLSGCAHTPSFYHGYAVKKYVTGILCCAIIFSIVPSGANAQTSERKTPRKYDKLLTAVESFAKLNAQIEIREREYRILAPFVQEVMLFSYQLQGVCDPKCYKSVTRYYSKLKKFNDALVEAHRRYQAMVPNIADRNAALMSEIKRVEFLSAPSSKEKMIAALNTLNLESLYHYKAYAKTYHSADTAMLSLASSSDLTSIIGSFATTTDRLVKAGRAQPSLSATIGNIKNKVPDIRARIKALEDRRKSLACTASLTKDYSVDIQCFP
jgi:hypothetical protein